MFGSSLTYCGTSLHAWYALRCNGLNFFELARITYQQMDDAKKISSSMPQRYNHMVKILQCKGTCLNFARTYTFKAHTTVHACKAG